MSYLCFTASAVLLPVGDTHCTESAATCPSNSKCDIIAPCMWGLTCSCNTGYELYTYYNVTNTYQYCVPGYFYVIILNRNSPFNAYACLKLKDNAWNWRLSYVTETALVGEVCDRTVQCSGKNTYCNGVGVCTCYPGTTVDSAKTECTLPPVTLLGQNCTGLLNHCGSKYNAIQQSSITDSASYLITNK